MSIDKIKIVERLKKKGLITKRDSLDELITLAIQENNKKSENLKKNSINLLSSQKSISKDQFLNMLISRLESY